MLTLSRHDVERLARVAQELQRLVESLLGGVESPDSVELSEEAEERVRNRECLQCGDPIEGPQSRGCCLSCYHASTYRVRRGKTTDNELVVAGLLLPKGFVSTSGPKRERRTKLDEFLDTKEAANLNKAATEFEPSAEGAKKLADSTLQTQKTSRRKSKKPAKKRRGDSKST